MYQNTPSSPQQQQHQQRVAGSLLRRRRPRQDPSRRRQEQAEQLLYVSLMPPNLIAVSPDEDSPSSSVSSSASSPSFSFSSPSFSSRSLMMNRHDPRKHDDDNDDVGDDDDDYVYDTVILVAETKKAASASFFSRLAPSSVTSLKKMVLMPLFVAIGSFLLCFPSTRFTPQPQVNYFHFSSSRRHAYFHGRHAPQVVFLDQNMNSARLMKASPSFITNASSASIRLRTSRRNRSKKSSVDDRPGGVAAAAPVFESRDCKAQYAWQLDNRVTCNRIHELDMLAMTAAVFQGDDSTKNKHHEDEDISSLSSLAIRHLGSGYWRDAWAFVDNDRKTKNNNDNAEQYVVLKTMRYRHGYTHVNLDRHRRDAMTAEHYTKSPHIVDIYAHCGNSAMFEYGNGGDLERVLGMNNKNANNNSDDDDNDDEEPAIDNSDTGIPNLLDRFHIAVQAATSLATLHNFDREGIASIAHADITLGQFISVNGTIKLNDFNRARFIAWNATSNAPCPYYIANNQGVMRSPEEYKYDPQTEKVDVYSFGNVLYTLLMLKWPFYEVDDYDDAENDDNDDDYSAFIGEQVIQGRRPFIPEEIRKSSNAIERAMHMAIRMCFEADPAKRISARQVETFLISQLEAIDPDRGRLETGRGDH